MPIPRSAFQQRVVEALIESKAVNLEVVGSVMSKLGEAAALSGESLVFVVNRPFFQACGWPGPEIDFGRVASAGEREVQG